MVNHFDLIVIGGGPAGEKAAVKAGYYGKRVALVERYEELGGSTVHNGTFPSKTLKETALFFSGKKEKGLFGVEKKLEQEFTVEDFFYRKNQVIRSEVQTINDNLEDHLVQVYHGNAGFVDDHTLLVTPLQAGDSTVLHADFILIATGSYPFRPPHIPFDGWRVHDSNTILEMERFPKSIVVIGAGVIGCEYSTIFSTMEIPVKVVDSRDTILPFIDGEVTRELIFQMRDAGVEFFFNSSVESVEVPADREQPLKIRLDQDRVLEADMLLFAAGRGGRTDGLHLGKVGLEATGRGLIEVNEHYQTKVPHIYAAGDVIGFPSLASTSMDQGRLAVTHMFQIEGSDRLAHYFPYGIYTIPEVSMVGLTVEEAEKNKLDFGVGKAYHNDMPRGKIHGTTRGFLKLVYERPSRKIVGVHVIGRLSSELIHYGVTVVEDGKTLEDVGSEVFNCPSLHELYKYAAYDGLANERGRPKPLPAEILVKE